MPVFDDVEYVGVAKLRGLNSRELKGMRHPLAIMGPEERAPLAVIIPYATYINMQDAIVQAMLCVQRWTLSQDLVAAIEKARAASGETSDNINRG